MAPNSEAVGPVLSFFSLRSSSPSPEHGEKRLSAWTLLRNRVRIFFPFVLLLVVTNSSITRFFSQAWTSTGVFMQSLWDRFLLKVGEDEFTLYVYGSTIWITAVYWVAGLAYTFMDVFNRPKWLRKYKVQPGTNEPVETRKLLECIGQVLFNQFFIGIPFAMCGFWVMEWRQTLNIHTLPSFARLVCELAFFIMFQEISFYYSHRLMHHRLLYKRVHKSHHEWTSPIAITALYCTPLEHLVANIMTTALGPIAIGSHIAVFWLWFAIAQLRTLNFHSGYHLPGFLSPEAHDYHHVKFTECYGLWGWLDRLHGTDKAFRSSASYKRHTISLSLTPVASLYPEEKSKTK